MITPPQRPMLIAGLLLSLGSAAMAQPPSAPAAEGPVGAMGQAVTQDYALRLRDAEAKLRAAHERLAAAGSPGPRSSQESPARQELLDAAQEAWETIVSAPRTIAGQPAFAEAERSFQEGFNRLRQSEPRDENEADTARAMLQALSTLREAAGAPPAPATGGPAATEPAAGGGGRT